MGQPDSEVICPYCDNPAKWVENKEIYGKNFGPSYMIWWCKPCDAYVGCHKNTTNPKGTLANKKLRASRVRAHAVFDPLWRSGRMNRKEAYALMASWFGREMHIGGANDVECAQIVDYTQLWITQSLQYEYSH